MPPQSRLFYWLKYAFWGVIIGFVVLFFMPDSRLSFNWHSAQQAWQLVNSKSQSLSNGRTGTSLNIENLSFADAVEKASPSVVSINVFRPKGLRDSDELAPDEKILDVGVGIGSGVVLSAQGYIVTNYHVIENADKISVNFTDGRRRLAEVVGADAESDIAVLKADVSGVVPAELAVGEDAKTGDIVMAIGNPFALDRQSVSLGIVSAVILPMSLQTDAAVNTGNSGGALINLKGEVIAINRGRFSSRGGGQTGLNYAIPINQVKRIAQDIILYGKVRQNWFGVNAIELRRDDHISQFPDIPFGSGFFVNAVEANSPAQKAGLKEADFITRFNNESISGVASFYRLFYSVPLGKKVDLEIIRQGKLVHLSVQLVERDPQKIN